MTSAIEFTTELRESDEDTHAYITSIARRLQGLGMTPDGKGYDVNYSMSLAIAVVAQTFLACGGNIQKGEQVGEMVKQGLITTIKAYKDMSRINSPISKRRN